MPFDAIIGERGDAMEPSAIAHQFWREKQNKVAVEITVQCISVHGINTAAEACVPEPFLHTSNDISYPLNTDRYEYWLEASVTNALLEEIWMIVAAYIVPAQPLTDAMKPRVQTW